MEPIENSLCELFKGTLGNCHEKMGKNQSQDGKYIQVLKLSVGGKKAGFYLNSNIHVICWKHGRKNMLVLSYGCDLKTVFYH